MFQCKKAKVLYYNTKNGYNEGYEGYQQNAAGTQVMKKLIPHTNISLDYY